MRVPTKQKTIYFITGASGVGKTTLLAGLKKKYCNTTWIFLSFDSVGVPPIKEMITKHGSASNWQRDTTYKWIDKMLKEYQDKERIFLEGQVNIEFINEGFKKHYFENYKIVLIDCAEEEMGYRLAHKRGHPELLTQDMRNWLKFLRNQAKKLNVPIINTTNRSLEDIVKEFEKEVRLL